MTKDKVFYIKELCEKSGCRYDIENDRYISEAEDMMECMKRTVARELKPIILQLLKGMSETPKKERDKAAKSYTDYKRK